VIVIVEKEHGFVIVLLRSGETNKQPEFRYLSGRRYVFRRLFCLDDERESAGQVITRPAIKLHPFCAATTHVA